ncbi:MAG: IPT/TIG domain-containing protein [Cyclobacteriaceae bacterium]|nr:IPT/TIG domain-containing protein [Cyclobacteriaceae bacterium]
MKKYKTILIICAIIASPSIVLAQTAGSLDVSFFGNTNGTVFTVALQPDNKIIIGGAFTSPRNYLARLGADGNLDTSFNPGTVANSTVYAVAYQPDGKIIFGGFGILVRLNQNGLIDASFNPGGTGPDRFIYAITIQPDGKIIIGGDFTFYNGTARERIARLNSDGSLDTSFDPGAGADNVVFNIALQSDGKIIIAGDFTSYNINARNRIARLNANGSIDTSFNPGTGANNTVRSISLQSNNKLLIGGLFTSYGGITSNRLARVNSDGSLDTSFNTGSGLNSTVVTIATQTDNKIVIGGGFTSYGGITSNRLARVNSDGSLDTSFDPGSGPNSVIYCTILQSDGKIIIGGSFTSYNGVIKNYIARVYSPSLVAEPTAQPTNLLLGSVTSTSMSVMYTAATGSPAGYIAVRRTGAAPTTDPVDGTAYTVNGALGNGTIEYVGSATTFSETGLTAATTYHYKIYAYNGSGGTINYRQTSPLSGSQSTSAAAVTEPAAQPTALSFASVTSSSFTVNYTAASGSPAGYIAVRGTGTTPTTDPVDGTAYTVNGALGNGTIAYVGSAATFSQSGLTASTTYHYKIYAYNGSGASINYRQTSPLSGSQATDVAAATEPTAQPTSLSFASVTSSSFTVNYTAATGSPAGYIAVRGTSTAPTTDPVDGTAYALNTSLGNGTIAYIGSAATFSQTALTASTTYHYKIYSYNGSGASINYRQTSPLSGSQATAAATAPAPTITSFNPTSGEVGTTVTITGTNFSATPASNTAKFNNTTAAVTASSATSITTSVPTGATTGKITVTVGGQTATSTSDFTVTVAVTEPTAQPTALTFANVTSSSFSISFTGAAGSPAGYIAVRRVGAAPTTDPVDGTAYALDATLGNGTIAYAGTTSSFSQSGLTPATTYHYKIYSYNGSGATINYRQTSPLTGSQATTALSAVQITNQTLPAQAPKSGTTAASITVSSTATIATVKFWSKGISEPASAYTSETLTATGTTYTKSLTSAILTDPIGLTYYFEVTDNTQATVLSNTGKTYLQFAATDQTIPNLRFGNQVSSYQIISVPLELTTKTVTAVFDELGAYDKKQWRLFTYSANDNREYPSFSTIDPGKGYWFIARTSTPIAVGEGKTVTADETTPFKLNLSTGWNLIGNPYNFRISWAEVLSANSTVTGVGNLKVFTSGALTDSDVLDRYQGAFVFTDANITLDVPVLRNKSLGGRVRGESSVENSLTDSHWEVPLYLSRDDLRNELAGIGMHPNAKDEGKDAFDQVSVPLPEGLGFFELQTNHPEVKTAFNKDVVTRKENNTWVMNVRRDENIPLTLSWENHFFGVNDHNLVLFDPATHQYVDMKTKTSYQIGKDTKSLWFIYGNKHYVESTLDSEIPQLGDPYPVPAKELVTIPYRIPSGSSVLVNLDVYDLQGRLVEKLVDNEHTSGSYSATWQTETRGMFLVRLKIGNSVQTKKISIQ